MSSHQSEPDIEPPSETETQTYDSPIVIAQFIAQSRPGALVLREGFADGFADDMSNLSINGCMPVHDPVLRDPADDHVAGAIAMP